MPKLSKLDLSHTRITDRGFAQLKGLKNITELNLYYAELIGDGALAAMRGWTQLADVEPARDEGDRCGPCPSCRDDSLESIDVGYSLFTDGGFEPLTAIPNLKSIAVGGNKVTDVGSPQCVGCRT